jgi:NADH-quinone oxidoreductase subunit J
MSLGLIFMYAALALVVVISGVGLITSRNAIYAALFLVLNFITVALLYIALGAPFIALAQVTVYAGSIMVLFLFVIMLLGAEQLPIAEPLRGQRVLGILLAVAFLAEMMLFVMLRGAPTIAGQAVSPGFSTPATIGMLLFERYLLPFEMTAGILLAATVGAVFMTRQPRPEHKSALPAVREEGQE